MSALHNPLARPADAAWLSTEARRNLAFLFAGVAAVGIVTGIYDTTFNNFLSDTYHLKETARGLVEFPRELPGFLVALLSGALFFLPEHRFTVLAMLILATGLFGLAFLSPTFGLMLVFMFLYSAGQHLFLPLQSALGLAMARTGKPGERLGQLSAVSTAATVVGCGIVWLGFEYFHLTYRGMFAVAGLGGLSAALLFTGLKAPEGISRERRRLVVKRRYSVYYVLNILYGARKQVFLTFGPWMIIKVLGQPASTIAKLWIAAAVLGVAVRALLGRAIDRLGERRVLVGEGVIVFLVCLAYALGPRFGTGAVRYWSAYTAYVVDQLLFAVSMARSTYLYKIAERPEDLTPTLSLAVTLDHAVSMTVPFFGGLLWAAFGFQYVFLVAAVIALVYLGVASGIRVPERSRESLT
ncbi:MAG: MFS transporter [Bacillota bacterium]|nr:MFS transporter [Bacillota bacterium]